MMTGEMRARVMARDGHCVAQMLDPVQAGSCADQWGRPVPLMPASGCEMDYVQRGHRGPRHAYAADHMAVCAGHHRAQGAQAGHQWSTTPAHRQLMRDWLDEHHRPTGPAGRCSACRAEVAWHTLYGWVDRETWEPHRHAIT